MQEIVTYSRNKDSHADIYDLLSSLNMTIDDFHAYTFQICPGSQVHLEIDTISSIQPHVHRFYEVNFSFRVKKSTIFWTPSAINFAKAICSLSRQDLFTIRCCVKQIHWPTSAMFYGLKQHSSKQSARAFHLWATYFRNVRKKTIIYCAARNPSFWNCR